MLAASSTTAVYTYVFIDNLHVSVLYWTLGTALGILLHIVLFPASIEYIAKGGAARRHFLVDAPRVERSDLRPSAAATGVAAEGLANERCDSRLVATS
jgi:hypothetical protein